MLKTFCIADWHPSKPTANPAPQPPALFRTPAKITLPHRKAAIRRKNQSASGDDV